MLEDGTLEPLAGQIAAALILEREQQRRRHSLTGRWKRGWRLWKVNGCALHPLLLLVRHSHGNTQQLSPVQRPFGCLSRRALS